jgi:CRP/FNR family transcriptional regulator, anaerobic regulatory protein
MAELEQLHFSKLEHRIANLILLRASSDGTLKMTQQEMAYHLGTAREVVSRILRIFVEKEYIETQRGKINILNAEKIADMITDEEF